MPGIKACSLAVLALVLAGTANAQGACGSWSPVSMPGAAGNGLASISASSATDAWAVWKAIYHWDGARWRLVPSPGLGTQDTVIRAVAAVSPGDAWVVGYTAFLGLPQTMTQRWDGAKWSIVPSPVIAGGSEFDAVVAVSANDVWAVGDRAGGHPEFAGTRVTLTAHWDGSHWTAVPSPNISDRSHSLLDVTAISSSDVWAVGYYRNIGESYRTLILHWNGASWSIVPSPNYAGENILFGVSGTAANDVWAVGDAWDGVTARQLFLHWNGSIWSLVTGPGGPTACVGCSGDVLAMGPNDVWAVGSSIGHWDGTDWALVSDPVVQGSIGFSLRSLAKVGDCDAWSVGGSFDSDLLESALSFRLSAANVSVRGPVASGAIALRVNPNPTRGESVIELVLPARERVRMTILDVAGRRVREVVSAVLPEGQHVFRWDGREDAGRDAGPGLYFVTVSAGGQRVSTTALRLK